MNHKIPVHTSRLHFIKQKMDNLMDNIRAEYCYIFVAFRKERGVPLACGQFVHFSPDLKEIAILGLITSKHL